MYLDLVGVRIAQFDTVAAICCLIELSVCGGWSYIVMHANFLSL
jgi:hypothetical protein